MQAGKGVRQTVTFLCIPRRAEWQSGRRPQGVHMSRISFRAAFFLLFASLGAYGASVIPASAYETGKELVTVALILTVNSLS